MGHSGAVSGHLIPMSFLQVVSWSMDPRVLGCHRGAPIVIGLHDY